MSLPFSVIIPARFASTRFPGKPLADLCGKPMIRHVWEQAGKSSASRVVIATDDPRIADAARGFDAEVVMTRTDHDSGTDRLAEAVALLGLADDSVVVNVQGDEPLVPPQIIDQVARNLALHPEAGIATLAELISDREHLFDPNVVKVVWNCDNMALTFSRAPLPWARDALARSSTELPQGIPYYRHIGLYAYRVSFLHRFVQWQSCWLERCESLEQLRALWHGVPIHVEEALETPPLGIDTPKDLEKARRFLGGR